MSRHLIQKYLNDLARLKARVARAEVEQALRIRLFVSTPNGPRIALYSGRGELAKWVRVSAAHVALNLLRRRNVEGRSSPDPELHTLLPSPELEYLKTRLAAEFNASVGDAVASLTPRERNVLRLHYVDGLTLEQVGVVYHVHRATVARWIERGRNRLVAEIRRVVVERLRVGATEMDSLVVQIWSRIDVALPAVLKSTADCERR